MLPGAFRNSTGGAKMSSLATTRRVRIRSSKVPVIVSVNPAAPAASAENESSRDMRACLTIR